MLAFAEKRNGSESSDSLPRKRICEAVLTRDRLNYNVAHHMRGKTDHLPAISSRQ